MAVTTVHRRGEKDPDEASGRKAIQVDTLFPTERVRPATFQARLPGSWAIAGLIDTGGRLDRQAAGIRVLSRFDVDLRAGFLVWRCGFADKIIDHRKPPGVLREFVSLDSEKKILRFAERFGVLGCCRHGLPFTHPYKLAHEHGWPSVRLPPIINIPQTAPRAVSQNHRKAAELGICCPVGWPPDWPPFVGYHDECWEPLEVWFHFARQLRALLQVQASLLSGRMTKNEDWECIYEGEWDRHFGFGDAESRRRIESSCMINAVNFWLRLGGVALELSVEGTPSIQGDGLFGELAYQLATAISQRRCLLVCGECGSIFEVKKLRKCELHRCQLCTRRLAWRRAQRRQRAR